MLKCVSTDKGIKVVKGSIKRARVGDATNTPTTKGGVPIREKSIFAIDYMER